MAISSINGVYVLVTHYLEWSILPSLLMIYSLCCCDDKLWWAFGDHYYSDTIHCLLLTSIDTVIPLQLLMTLQIWSIVCRWLPLILLMTWSEVIDYWCDMLIWPFFDTIVVYILFMTFILPCYFISNWWYQWLPVTDCCISTGILLLTFNLVRPDCCCWKPRVGCVSGNCDAFIIHVSATIHCCPIPLIVPFLSCRRLTTW